MRPPPIEAEGVGGEYPRKGTGDDSGYASEGGVGAASAASAT